MVYTGGGMHPLHPPLDPPLLQPEVLFTGDFTGVIWGSVCPRGLFYRGVISRCA